MESSQYRVIAEKWNLGKSFPKAMLYARQEDFGLGFTSPETVALAASMAAVMTILNAEDEAIRNTARHVCTATLTSSNEGIPIPFLKYVVKVAKTPRRGTSQFWWPWWLRQVERLDTEVVEQTQACGMVKWVLRKKNQAPGGYDNGWISGRCMPRWRRLMLRCLLIW